MALVIGGCDELGQGTTSVVGEFAKKSLSFGFCEGAHGPYMGMGGWVIEVVEEVGGGEGGGGGLLIQTEKMFSSPEYGSVELPKKSKHSFHTPLYAHT